MGRRKNRKQERRQSRWERDTQPTDIGLPPIAYTGQALEPTTSYATPPEAEVCGRCREFIEDPEGGRGTCLHPASGVLSPWSDTASCDFFDAPVHRRR